jgi:hypothetical protein
MYEKIKGSDRRLRILREARTGIRLNVEGGRGYDRDMRRLHREGLVRIVRPGHHRLWNRVRTRPGYFGDRCWPWHFVSLLMLTPKGEQRLGQT